MDFKNYTKEEALKEIQDLVEKFGSKISEYKNKKYDETNVRRDFIDKFFRYLNWDVGNDKGHSEEYRSVVLEDKVIIDGKPKAPDYSFRTGGQRKFFVEAKRPSVDIKHKQEAALQVRRYAYTAKLSLSILTDFEEFAIYDTRIKPEAKDDASVSRIFYCTYKDYIKKFDFLYKIFTEEGILQGSFDEYIGNTKNKRGTSSVDKEFLKTLDQWRTELAKYIAKHNTQLNIDDINLAVQKIIDRIIFLRFAEDQNIQKYGLLKELLQKETPFYKTLNKVFLQANKKYNSSLFTPIDYISKLIIPDKVFHTIIRGLYFPQCPYEFSVLPIEVLGSIYEQFLGKTIRLTSSHQAKIEDKPMVRKAGGVYYTPQYIVDYIINNTIGEKFKNQNINQIKELTICDPACGSGSFLVRAYDYLLKWYFNKYNELKNKNTKVKDGTIFLNQNNEIRLTIRTKQEILRNHIYGVDIDKQAVEVTKLSLLLKLMEGESEQTIAGFLQFDDHRILPDLSSNIKCGNALLGTNIYNGTLKFDLEENKKINAFDWEKEFQDVFALKDKNAYSGFDCVIGNPPYIQLQKFTGEKIQEVMAKAKFKSHHSMGDIYSLFYEKGMSLLKPNGLLGFITSNKWMRAGYGINTREFFIQNTNPIQLLDFSGNKIFEDATVDCNILILEKNENKHKCKAYTFSDKMSSFEEIQIIERAP